jgi:hypothetical protein
MKSKTRTHGTIQVLGITAVLFGVAGLAIAKDPMFNPGMQVQFQTTVAAVRVVPEGNPLPGLHLDAKVKGRMVDIYIAPMSFVTRYGVRVGKGDFAEIEGTQIHDDVLAKSITTGIYDKVRGIFRPDMTIFLRDEAGPFWVEETH